MIDFMTRKYSVMHDLLNDLLNELLNDLLGDERGVLDGGGVREEPLLVEG